MSKVESNESKSLRVVLSSGDEDYPGCALNVVFWRWHITVNLPPIIQPHREKVMAKSWDAATVARLGRDWYWNVTERQYGFYLFENHFNVLLGRQTHDSSTEQRWGCFLPWGEWRFVRHSLYDLKGELLFTSNGRDYDRFRIARDATPKTSFLFNDFDGEEVTAATYIEEREWHRGEGWFKWLSLFWKPRIRRNLDIHFNKETGPRKGSWKGGIIGHSIDLLSGELHEEAFRRYCEAHNMAFIGRVA